MEYYRVWREEQRVGGRRKEGEGKEQTPETTNEK